MPGLAGPVTLPPGAGATADGLATRSASPPGGGPPATAANTATAATAAVLPAAAVTSCPREAPHGP